MAKERPTRVQNAKKSVQRDQCLAIGEAIVWVRIYDKGWVQGESIREGSAAAEPDLPNQRIFAGIRGIIY